MVKTIKNKRNKRKSKKIIGGMEAGLAVGQAGFSIASSIYNAGKKGLGKFTKPTKQTTPPIAGQSNTVKNPVVEKSSNPLNSFSKPNPGIPGIGPQLPANSSQSQSLPTTLKVSSILPFTLPDGRQLVDYKTFIAYIIDMNRRVNDIVREINKTRTQNAKSWENYKKESNLINKQLATTQTNQSSASQPEEPANTTKKANV